MSTQEREEVFYVCDTCGHIEREGQVPEGGEWTCSADGCDSHTAWEFPFARRANAYAHARHIMNGVGKGSIFRDAKGRRFS